MGRRQRKLPGSIVNARCRISLLSGPTSDITYDILRRLRTQKASKPMTDGLMTAQEAARKCDGMSDVRGQRVRRQAKKAIEGAVLLGARQVSLDVEYRDQKRLKDWLLSLGYKVNCGDSQSDGVWFQVSW